MRTSGLLRSARLPDLSERCSNVAQITHSLFVNQLVVELKSQPGERPQSELADWVWSDRAARNPFATTMYLLVAMAMQSRT